MVPKPEHPSWEPQRKGSLGSEGGGAGADLLGPEEEESLWDDGKDRAGAQRPRPARPPWIRLTGLSFPPFSLNVSPAEKPGLTERKGGLGVPSRDRNVGAPGQDTPGVSLQPLPGDSLDREPGETFPVLTVRPPQSSPSVRPSPSVPP